MKVKAGNVTVRLYPTPTTIKGTRYPAWTVAWLDEAGRQRKKFSKRADAAKFADDKADLLDKGYKFHVTPDQLASYNRAHDLLLPFGKTVEGLAQEYADARPQVNLSLMSAFWDKHHTGDMNATPASVLSELLAEKRQNGASRPYLHSLEVRLGKFSTAFQTPLASITAGPLAEWLAAIPGKPRTRRNYREALASLFQFAKVRRYLPRDWAELPPTAREMATATPIEIYTPKEISSLLAAAANGAFKHPLAPLLALGAFAGIRTWEILRLRWEDIGPKWIEVKSKRTRTASRRLVPVLPALKPWLALHRRPEGPVCPYNRIELALARLARSANLKWKRNALRHSFISYRVAQVQDVAQVSLECGNTPAMIFQHYRELVTPQQAANWFRIRPKNVTKIPRKSTKPL